MHIITFTPLEDGNVALIALKLYMKFRLWSRTTLIDFGEVEISFRGCNEPKTLILSDFLVALEAIIICRTSHILQGEGDLTKYLERSN